MLSFKMLPSEFIFVTSLSLKLFPVNTYLMLQHVYSTLCLKKSTHLFRMSTFHFYVSGVLLIEPLTSWLPTDIQPNLALVSFFLFIFN